MLRFGRDRAFSDDRVGLVKLEDSSEDGVKSTVGIRAFNHGHHQDRRTS